MRTERIHELRVLAGTHKGHRSAGIILECLDEIEKLQRWYCIALDAAYKTWPLKGQARKKLKTLAGL